MTYLELISLHYKSHVMGQGDPVEVRQTLKDAFTNDAELRQKAQERLEELDNFASQCNGQLDQRDFCGHIERIALKRALG